MAIPLCFKQNVTATAAAQQVSTHTYVYTIVIMSCVLVSLRNVCVLVFADLGGNIQTGISVQWVEK